MRPSFPRTGMLFSGPIQPSIVLNATKLDASSSDIVCRDAVSCWFVERHWLSLPLPDRG
jgi:hypothetical protein